MGRGRIERPCGRLRDELERADSGAGSHMQPSLRDEVRARPCRKQYELAGLTDQPWRLAAFADVLLERDVKVRPSKTE